MLPAALTQYLRAHRDRHLAELGELLAIPSLAAAGDDGCSAAARWLREHLQRLGLEAETVASAGPPNVLAELHAAEGRPTLLLYGHYDVQPPDPLEAWASPPFTPTVRDGCLYARGASDDKGQLFAQLMAVEAWQRAGGGLPVNLKVFIEGEEEIGSPHLEAFLGDHAGRLAADAAVISDSEFFADDLPSITIGLRGLAYVEVTVRGPSADLHSGVHGGAVRNPADVLAALVAALHDGCGRVTIPGFYDDVLDPSAQEQAAWAQLPFDEQEYAASLGLKDLTGGEAGLPVLHRRWSRPTLDCNGLVGGYTGRGAKTIIPAAATAKLSMRLVPRQQPDKVTDALRSQLQRLCPPGVTLETSVLSSARPVLLAADSPAMRAAQAALAEAFGREPAFIRCGASVPVTELIQRLLKLDAVLMGFGLPSDNLHSPNEHFRLEQLWRGSLAAAAFLKNLAAGGGT
jgi:acetylornithine deacetylase/succinyl-diaminopimelate desuccinylase-like protein